MNEEYEKKSKTVEKLIMAAEEIQKYDGNLFNRLADATGNLAMLLRFGYGSLGQDDHNADYKPSVAAGA